MKILYDSQIFLKQKAGGISRYHYELYRGMLGLGFDVRIAGKFIKNQYLLSDQTLGKKFWNDPSASFAFLNKLLISNTVKNKKYDLYHPSDNYDFLLDKIPTEKKMVFTIHDLIMEKENIESAKPKLAYALRADKIIAVSNNTKNDIVDMLGIEANKIEVIYHGVSFKLEHAKKISNLPSRYILFVGNREGYKNFDTFVKGAAITLKTEKDLYIVCAGRRGFSNKEQETFRELGISNKIVAYSMITDNEMIYLYQRAEAFVFPSISEGFGVPILEAWTCNVPLILSDNSCFREVAAEAGQYFDPKSPESIAENISMVLNDKILSRELVVRGSKRLELFSWEKTVKQTADLYQSVL